jgi:hypothetical protein
MTRRASCFVAALLLLGTVLGHNAQAEPGGQLGTKHLMTTLGGFRDLPPMAKRPASWFPLPTWGNGIQYHNGPLLLGTPNAYVIWYGAWAAPSQSILTNFLTKVGGSPYYNINTTYMNGAGTHVSNAVHYGGSTTDNYSLGKTLSDAGVLSVVSSAVTSGRLPKDTNGVYFVLTSGDVKESSGFLTTYCGWHDYATVAGADLKYSFVGDPSAKPSACAVQTTMSPNGNPMADAMVSVIAHELEEAVTDPDLNAWYDFFGNENADKCAWKFGTTYTVANGSKANMNLGGSDFLIQQNWVNASGGYCATSY